MRVMKIQSTVVKPQNQQKFNKVSRIANQPEQPIANPTFKGGDGALAGLGGGLITGLIVIGGGAIAGVLALPTIIGSAAIVGAGVAGAYIGDKIGDAITGKNKKGDKNNY